MRATPKSRIWADRGVDQNIRRLQIAMDHVLLMGVMHRCGDRGHQTDALANADMLGSYLLVDGHALHKLQHLVPLRTHPGNCRTALVDTRNPDVAQSSQRLHFHRKAAEQFVGHLVCTNQLQGDAPLRLRLQGFVNRAHAAAADLANDSVRPDL
jgi:hypothetical protein